MKYIRVLGWEKFQHYKNRNPPWIKLYREMITSRTWLACDDASRVLAITCMLLAAEYANAIPFDLDYLKQRTFRNEDIDLQQLIDLNFLEIVDEAELILDSASKMLDRGEKRREETEKRINPSHESEQNASNVLAKEGTDAIVEEIAHAYPGNQRALGVMIIPHAHCNAICEAIARDGEAVVRRGTLEYAECVSRWPTGEKRMVWNAVKFYSESHYLDDPQLWERGSGKPSSKQQERTQRNRETILDAIREDAREVTGLGGANDRKRTV